MVSIITDSLACLTREMVSQYGILIVPISIYFRDKVYRDWVDISPTEAYKLFLQDPESFATSPSSPGQYLEAYREASNRTKDILCVTLSSKLSTGYEVARVAREQAMTELPGVSIEVMDSLTVTAAEGLIALAAAREAAEGKDLAQVIKTAESVRSRVNFLILLETVRYVYRTGRIPKIAARLGSMLNIKPILSMADGLVRFAGAVRNKDHGINRLIEILRNRVGQKAVRVAVMHAYAPEEAEKLKQRLASEFNCTELWLTEFSPVMGYACGTGSLGFAFYTEGES